MTGPVRSDQANPPLTPPPSPPDAQVLAATQTPGEGGSEWFQGTADAVRQYSWLFEDIKNRDCEHCLILSGDHLYRMDYMQFVQAHVDSGADITVSALPMDDSRASDFGLMKIDNTGRIIDFAEKPKGAERDAMKCDTTVLGLSAAEAAKSPYIASMGIYVFKKSVMVNLLNYRFPEANDFGSEIIPAAAKELKVQAYLFNDYWEDIGTIRSFFDANLALAKVGELRLDSLLGQSPPLTFSPASLSPAAADVIICANPVFRSQVPPRFEFYDAKNPIYTSPRFLPPAKITKSKIKDAIISHGSQLDECIVENAIIG